MADDTANSGLMEAHTPPVSGSTDPGSNRSGGEIGQPGLEAGQSDAGKGDASAQEHEIDGIQPGLFEPAEEVALPLPIDPREIEADGKRAPGRPRGSSNKRSKDMAAFLLAQGFRDPMQALAAAYSADTKAMAMRLSRMRAEMRRELLDRGWEPVAIDKALPADLVDPLEVYKLQLAAARDALPFWHARKTPEDAPPPQVRPVMVIGEFHGQMQVNTGAMSAGEAPDAKAQGNQPVTLDHSSQPTVRQAGDASHDASQVIDDSRETEE